MNIIAFSELDKQVVLKSNLCTRKSLIKYFEQKMFVLKLAENAPSLYSREVAGVSDPAETKKSFEFNPKLERSAVSGFLYLEHNWLKNVVYLMRKTRESGWLQSHVFGIVSDSLALKYVYQYAKNRGNITSLFSCAIILDQRILWAFHCSRSVCRSTAALLQFWCYLYNRRRNIMHEI